jgi:hypothetical protein
MAPHLPPLNADERTMHPSRLPGDYVEVRRLTKAAQLASDFSQEMLLSGLILGCIGACFVITV